MMSDKQVITAEMIDRIVEKVKGPDNRFSLRDVERELAAETGISLQDARRAVRARDRKMLLRPEDL